MARRVPWLALLLVVSFARAQEPQRVEWDLKTLTTVYDPGRASYCYAPSVIVDEKGVEHVFACRNREPHVIRDHIYYLTRQKGAISEPQIVLTPGEKGAWDGFHVCDPSVVHGKFRFDGVDYAWAMFYLGNNVDASRDNQIGVAFARDLAGPWKRWPKPIVAYPPSGAWGVGQPSAISDGGGSVSLFYTSARAYIRSLDLSDMNRPIVGEATQLTRDGLLRSDGRDDRLNNFDVCLDGKSNRIFAVREQGPYPRVEPSFIGPSVEVASIDANALKSGAGHWRSEGVISPAVTGFARNHNAGFVRSPTGRTVDGQALRVIFTSSEEEPALKGLFAPWTYVLHELRAAAAP